MGELVLESAKIVGASDEIFWSQVHTFLPEKEKKKARRGQLLAVFSLRKISLGEEELVSFGREAISRLHEEYFGNLSGEILMRLKEAVLKVKEEFEGGMELEIVAGVLGGEAIYLVVLGEGKAVLKRGERLGVICRGEREKVNSSSGFLKKGDLLLLGTRGFFRNVAEGSLKAAMMTGAVGEVVESLTPMVFGEKGLKGAAAVVAKAKEKEEIKEKEEKKEMREEGGRGRLSFWRRFRRRGGIVKRRVVRGGESLGRLRPEWGRRKRKTFLLIAGVLVVILGLSVFWGVRQRQVSEKQEAREGALVEATEKLEEGRLLIELNPIRARQLLAEAKELAAAIEIEAGTEAEVLALREEIEEALSLALGEYRLEKLAVFFDLKIISEEARGERLALSGDLLVVLDKEKGAVYEVKTKTKGGEILAGGEELAGAFELAFSEEKVWVLAREGVVEKELKSKTQKVVVEADPGWGRIVDFGVYGGNLYLLDQGEADLYRYPVIEGGFGSKQSWLKGERRVLEGAISMAIDGSIWILKEGGEILKFTHGLADPFAISGGGEGFGKEGEIYTEGSLENLYILDKEKQRVVILGKDGEYRAFYEWRGGEGIEEIAVSEEAGRIWLLGGSKIYEIGLKK